MSLYDDIVGESTTEKVAGWSSGIKLLQSQMQLFKKTAKKSETPKRSLVAAAAAAASNVNEVRYRKIEDSFQNESTQLPRQTFCSASSNVSVSNAAKIHNEWSIADEYNPERPNDYEKVLKELRDLSREREKRRKRKNRFNESNDDTGSGSEFDDSDRNIKRLSSVSNKSSRSPKRESNSNNSFTMPNKPSSAPISAVAAKIMAKYGFKEGQGLGRQEQGIASALQVEKVSKTCGRIIQPGLEMPPPSSLPPPKPEQSPLVASTAAEVNITEIMKKPSKVIMLRNMVGPGEVDAELEPEVREECNGKYGEVVRVFIRELKNVVDEEAVRIFVEFKRIESAIKAVVDLNGRFFGGRNVKAIFYDWECFNAGDVMQGAPKSSI